MSTERILSLTGDRDRAGIAVDVNDLLRAKSVLDDTSDFVAIIDGQGHPHYINRSLAETFGIEEGRKGSIFARLTPISRVRLHDELLPTVRQKGIVRDELALVGPDNAVIPMSVVIVAHDQGDASVGWLSFVGRDISEQHALQDQLGWLASHDPLTTLPNRRLFFRELDLALARATQRKTTCAVLFIDVDDFKSVNDDFGHEAGDAVLFTVAGRLDGVLRSHDVLSRLGGDEFAALCEDVDEASVFDIAQRLLAGAPEPVRCRGGDVTVTVSVGIGLVCAGQCDADELLRDADRAMYEAKRAGKNRVVLTRRGSMQQLPPLSSP
jgi:diguanylate cyclase (GGDEF)-like protein